MVWSFEHRLKRRKSKRETQQGQAPTVQAVQEEEGQGTFGLYGEIQYTGRH